jgi:hypothetical protein
VRPSSAHFAHSRRVTRTPGHGAILQAVLTLKRRPRAPPPSTNLKLCPREPPSSSASSTVCALTPAALTHVARQEWSERDGRGCYGRQFWESREGVRRIRVDLKELLKMNNINFPRCGQHGGMAGTALGPYVVSGERRIQCPRQQIDDRLAVFCRASRAFF